MCIQSSEGESKLGAAGSDDALLENCLCLPNLVSHSSGFGSAVQMQVPSSRALAPGHLDHFLLICVCPLPHSELGPLLAVKSFSLVDVLAR